MQNEESVTPQSQQYLSLKHLDSVRDHAADFSTKQKLVANIMAAFSYTYSRSQQTDEETSAPVTWTGAHPHMLIGGRLA